MYLASVLALVLVGSLALTYGFMESNRVFFLVGIAMLSGAVLRIFTMPPAAPAPTHAKPQPAFSIDEGLRSAGLLVAMVLVGSGSLLWGFVGPNRLLFAIGIAFLAMAVLSMFRESPVRLPSRKGD
ncbi:MAG: hypothetical protein WD533_08600 [Dehalococcoidia bacterium]